MENQEQVIAFAWYQPDEWIKLKNAVDDPSTLDDSYEAWYTQAVAAVSQLQKSNQKVQKISIKANELLKWCASQGCQPNARARSEYVAELAQKRMDKSSKKS